MAFCERQQKQFATRKPLFDRTFCAPCTSASVERVFNNGGYLLGHTDASKSQVVSDCGKLLSLGSNKPGKQTVHGLKCHLQKCHKDIHFIHYTVHEECGIPSRITCKNGETGQGRLLAAHCTYRADLVTECMKKHQHYQVTFVFGRKWNSFSSALSFTAENLKKCFRSA